MGIRLRLRSSSVDVYLRAVDVCADVTDEASDDTHECVLVGGGRRRRAQWLEDGEHVQTRMGVGDGGRMELGHTIFESRYAQRKQRRHLCTSTWNVAHRTSHMAHGTWHDVVPYPTSACMLHILASPSRT